MNILGRILGMLNQAIGLAPMAAAQSNSTSNFDLNEVWYVIIGAAIGFAASIGSCDHSKTREATAMLSVSEIVAKTEAMFDLFNHHFYNGEITRPAITVSPDGGRGAYGWCSVYEIWQASGEAYREINICAEYIDRPIGEVAATMLHEMAHLYNLTHEIRDVSNNGYYHNKKFKDTAEAHGLHIEHHATYGWTITTLSEETAEWLTQQPGMADITASRKTMLQIKTKADDDEGGETTTTIKGGRSTSKNRSIKYVCPHCGAIIRATRQVNVVCGDCDVPFEQA